MNIQQNARYHIRHKNKLKETEHYALAFHQPLFRISAEGGNCAHHAAHDDRRAVKDDENNGKTYPEHGDEKEETEDKNDDVGGDLTEFDDHIQPRHRQSVVLFDDRQDDENTRKQKRHHRTEQHRADQEKSVAEKHRFHDRGRVQAIHSQKQGIRKKCDQRAENVFSHFSPPQKPPPGCGTKLSALLRPKSHTAAKLLNLFYHTILILATNRVIFLNDIPSTNANRPLSDCAEGLQIAFFPPRARGRIPKRM